MQTEAVGEIGVFLILFACGLECSPFSLIKVFLGVGHALVVPYSGCPVLYIFHTLSLIIIIMCNVYNT